LCRLIAVAAREPPLSDIETLLNALIEASRHDPRLERVSGGARSSHDDGWGLAAVMVVERDGVKKVGYIYERSSLPIFDPLSVKVLKHLVKKACSCTELYIVVHARAASRGEPLGTEAAHPYREDIDSRGAIWFAHNGSANKDALARELGVSPALHTDSELLAMHIACELREELSRRGSLQEFTKVLSAILKRAIERFCPSRAAVSALLAYLDGCIDLLVTTYAPRESPRLEYYRPYVVSLPRVKAVVSPTVADVLRDKGVEVREAELDRVAKVTPEGVQWLDVP